MTQLPSSNFLLRLLRDPSANVFALVGAAMIPLLLIVGGTVDISRFYMAATRLQNACDSGALAARKAMLDTDFSDEERDQGLAFFDHNYPDGTFGLTNLQRDYTADVEGVVTGTATGNLPTTIMSFFGHGSFQLEVDCSAEINISNTDIMFVLDVTGSMNCAVSNPGCWGQNNEAAGSRLQGLREAVVSFYDVVDGSTSSAAQVRYGFLPYSSNINVGGIIPNEFMAAAGAYQTRVPMLEFTTDGADPIVTVDSVYNEGGYNFQGHWWDPNGGQNFSNQAECNAYAASHPQVYEDQYINGSIDEDSITVISETVVGSTLTRVVTATGDFSRIFSRPYWGNYGSANCWVYLREESYSADFQATMVETITSDEEFDEWLYTFNDGTDPDAPMWDLTGMYTDGFITLPTGANGTDQVHNWDGCIEEAATTTDTVFEPLPAGAFDMDINLVPATEEQRWKPTLPDAVYKREAGSNNQLADMRKTGNENLADYDCPKFATRLAPMTRDQVTTYLRADQGFTAQGSTYHNIGMLWGARMISPSGMFAADNFTAPNGDLIGRHIVFMTDGVLSTDTEVYTPYGIHWWDRRVSTSTNGNTTEAAHAARFLAACRQARAENITVWVVAFGGIAPSADMDECATAEAFEAADSAALAATFAEIAQRIASLRLTS